MNCLKFKLNWYKQRFITFQYSVVQRKHVYCTRLYYNCYLFPLSGRIENNTLSIYVIVYLTILTLAEINIKPKLSIKSLLSTVIFDMSVRFKRIIRFDVYYVLPFVDIVPYSK